MLGDKKRILEAGDTIVLPARIKHQWWNPGRQEVRFRVEVVPARKLEAVIEAVCGMAEAGALDKRAMPTNIFRLAQLGMLSETYLPGIPIWVQRVLMAIGSGTSQLLGYDPEFTEYRIRDGRQIERIAG
jgi:hypothetical protein